MSLANFLSNIFIKADFTQPDGQVLDSGSTGEVRRVGDEVHKNATEKETRAYAVLNGTPGIAPARIEGSKIITPHFPNIVSVDTIPHGKRSGYASIIKQAYPKLVHAITKMSHAGLDYNDVLQVGFNKQREPHIFDFSMAENTGEHEATKENLSRFSAYLKTFGLNRHADGISSVSNLIHHMEHHDNELMQEEPDIHAAKKVLSHLGGKPAKYFYYSTNGRTIPNVAQTGNSNGFNTIVSSHPLDEKFMNDWEITPVVHDYEHGKTEQKSLHRFLTKATLGSGQSSDNSKERASHRMHQAASDNLISRYYVNDLVDDGKLLPKSAVSSDVLAGVDSTENAGESKKPWEMSRSEFIDNSDSKVLEHMRSVRGSRLSNTDKPEEHPNHPIGSWRIGDDRKWNSYGDFIEQLREIPIDKITVSEDSKGREHYIDQYAKWIDAGHMTPPIRVAKREDGTYHISDGHRRLLAHKLSGKDKIHAWVSDPHETGLFEPSGKPIMTDATHQLVIAQAIKQGKPVPQHVLDEYHANQKTEQKSLHHFLTKATLGSNDDSTDVTPETQALRKQTKQGYAPGFIDTVKLAQSAQKRGNKPDALAHMGDARKLAIEHGHKSGLFAARDPKHIADYLERHKIAHPGTLEALRRYGTDTEPDVGFDLMTHPTEHTVAAVPVKHDKAEEHDKRKVDVENSVPMKDKGKFSFVYGPNGVSTVFHNANTRDSSTYSYDNKNLKYHDPFYLTGHIDGSVLRSGEKSVHNTDGLSYFLGHFYNHSVLQTHPDGLSFVRDRELKAHKKRTPLWSRDNQTLSEHPIHNTPYHYTDESSQEQASKDAHAHAVRLAWPESVSHLWENLPMYSHSEIVKRQEQENKSFRRGYQPLSSFIIKARAKWNAELHPRDDGGRFVSKEAITAASRSPKKAEQLRAKVTDPDQRAKLDAAIKAHGKGDTSVGTKKHVDAAHRLAEKIHGKGTTATREELEAFQESLQHKDFTKDDLHELADRLGVRASGTKDTVRGKVADRGVARDRSDLRKFAGKKVSVADAKARLQAAVESGELDTPQGRQKLQDMLTGMSRADVRALAKEMGVKVSGSKDEMAAQVAKRTGKKVEKVAAVASQIPDVAMPSAVEESVSDKVKSAIHDNTSIVANSPAFSGAQTVGELKQLAKQKFGDKYGGMSIKTYPSGDQIEVYRFVDGYQGRQKKIAATFDLKDPQPKQEEQGTPSQTDEPHEITKRDFAKRRYGLESPFFTNPYGESAPGADWDSRQSEHDDLTELYSSGHRSAVERALASGKPVPAEVLADYPDLAEKHGKQEEATPKLAMPSALTDDQADAMDKDRAMSDLHSTGKQRRLHEQDLSESQYERVADHEAHLANMGEWSEDKPYSQPARDAVERADGRLSDAQARLEQSLPNRTRMMGDAVPEVEMPSAGASGGWQPKDTVKPIGEISKQDALGKWATIEITDDTGKKFSSDNVTIGNHHGVHRDMMKKLEGIQRGDKSFDKLGADPESARIQVTVDGKLLRLNSADEENELKKRLSEMVGGGQAPLSSKIDSMNDDDLLSALEDEPSSSTSIPEVSMPSAAATQDLTAEQQESIKWHEQDLAKAEKWLAEKPQSMMAQQSVQRAKKKLEEVKATIHTRFAEQPKPADKPKPQQSGLPRSAFANDEFGDAAYGMQSGKGDSIPEVAMPQSSTITANAVDSNRERGSIAGVGTQSETPKPEDGKMLNLEPMQILSYSWIKPEYAERKRLELTTLLAADSPFRAEYTAEVEALEKRLEDEAPIRAERERLIGVLRDKNIIPSKYKSGEFVRKTTTGWSAISKDEVARILTQSETQKPEVGKMPDTKAKKPKIKATRLPKYYPQGGWTVNIDGKDYGIPGVKDKDEAIRVALTQLQEPKKTELPKVEPPKDDDERIRDTIDAFRAAGISASEEWGPNEMPTGKVQVIMTDPTTGNRVVHLVHFATPEDAKAMASGMRGEMDTKKKQTQDRIRGERIANSE